MHIPMDGEKTAICSTHRYGFSKLDFCELQHGKLGRVHEASAVESIIEILATGNRSFSVSL
jgi:hypothetical protein